MADLPPSVRIVEVGPRDGLQNETQFVPTEAKLKFIEALRSSGLSEIEITSFVSPKAIPQLADAAEVIKQVTARGGCRYSALVPNERGLDRAMAAGIERMAVFTAASETFARKNIRMTVAESLATFGPLVRKALDAGISVRGYVSTSFVCPYEGAISLQQVSEVSQAMLDMGVDEVAISDTIGAAVPSDVTSLMEHLLDTIPAERIALHFHDTYGTALANVVAGLQMEIATFDASAGGLGGCPFAPGAAGNLATEDLVYLLERMGISTGVGLQKVLHASDVVAKALGRELPGRQWKRWHCSQC